MEREGKGDKQSGGGDGGFEGEGGKGRIMIEEWLRRKNIHVVRDPQCFQLAFFTAVISSNCYRW